VLATTFGVVGVATLLRSSYSHPPIGERKERRRREEDEETSTTSKENNPGACSFEAAATASTQRTSTASKPSLWSARREATAPEARATPLN
jgi:hypothetical protein